MAKGIAASFHFAMWRGKEVASMPEVFFKDEAEWREIKRRHVSSTETPTLFGFSTWATMYSLWMAKRNVTDFDSPDDERMGWGRRLEPVIAQAAADEKHWRIERADVFVTHPSIPKLGCSLDYYAQCPERGAGILECKNRDWFVWKNAWTDAKVAPEVYIQVQTQLACTGLAWACVACLVGGNQLHLYPIERDAELIAKIEERTQEFWATIDAETKPPVTGAPADFRALSALFADVEEGKVIHSEEMALAEAARMFDDFRERRLTFGKAEDGEKAKLLAAMEDAEALHVPGAVAKRTKTARGVRFSVKVDHSFKATEDWGDSDAFA